mmetsp:Transcript_134211/g.189642  ORF Transcript_134211/g.189642 Transcript_134211/m.189642 type:complete len:235 (+) Transcript_134211:2220-2924(+)
MRTTVRMSMVSTPTRPRSSSLPSTLRTSPAASSSPRTTATPRPSPSKPSPRTMAGKPRTRTSPPMTTVLALATTSSSDLPTALRPRVTSTLPSSPSSPATLMRAGVSLAHGTPWVLVPTPTPSLPPSPTLPLPPRMTALTTSPTSNPSPLRPVCATLSTFSVNTLALRPPSRTSLAPSSCLSLLPELRVPLVTLSPPLPLLARMCSSIALPPLPQAPWHSLSRLSSPCSLFSSK